ncbi:hypothetical protein GNP44_18835 [Aliivibrio fischeri]|uniref:hypothetical protein n=1 Tax=Aliivibrio fischeri TaxID=668 RepID=UPI0012D88A5B|nr:hypothetical protein [Aliivibrio fischeri]MUK32126.1 hypothetical protein [Aliivibrio fischeri]
MNKVKKEALELLDVIEKRSEVINDPDIQKELGLLICHIYTISKKRDEFLLKSAKIAYSSIIKEPCELNVIKQINENLAHRKKPPYDRMTPSTKVILGLCICFYFAFSLLIVGGTGFKVPDTFFGINSSLVLLAAGSGAIGSIVSIMSRVGEFVDLAHRDHMVYLFIGLFKPLIGMAFAVFVFCVVKAGIIPIDLGEQPREELIIAALAFLSGFSERFAKDFTQKTEKVLNVSAT